MKTADAMHRFNMIVMLPIVLLAAACSSIPAKRAPEQVACNAQPQWFTKNDAGQEVGIFVCFGRDNALLYQTRILPPQPAAEKQPRDPKTGKFTAKPKPTPILLPDQRTNRLPTLGGTTK